MERYFTELATAFVRGRTGLPDATIQSGLKAGLRLHKFKRDSELPRVKRVLGALRGLAPESILDIGSGRGTFLWPLLDAFPSLPVTAVDWSDQRVQDLCAVRAGGIDRLSVMQANVETLELAPRSFDVATVLEVLEHLRRPEEALRRVVAATCRFVVISVPSKADENPEHLHLFTPQQLQSMGLEAGCRRVTVEHVLNHRIAVCQI